MPVSKIGGAFAASELALHPKASLRPSSGRAPSHHTFASEVMDSADDPGDELGGADQALADDAGWSWRVKLTFHPDKYLDPASASASGNTDMDRSARIADVDTGAYAGWVAAMWNRGWYSQDRGDPRRAVPR